MRPAAARLDQARDARRGQTNGRGTSEDGSPWGSLVLYAVAPLVVLAILDVEGHEEPVRRAPAAFGENVQA